MDMFQELNAPYKDCQKCKALEIISLAGHPVCACRNFQNPKNCKKKELPND